MPHLIVPKRVDFLEPRLDVNWSNPIAHGLFGGLIHTQSGPIECVSGRPGLAVNTVSRGKINNEHGFAYDTTSYNYVDLPYRPASLVEFTAFCVCAENTQNNSYYGPFEITSGTALNSNPCARYEYGGAQPIFIIWESGGTRRDLAGITRSFADRERTTIAITNSSAGHRGYFNGVQHASTSGRASVRVPSRIYAGANWGANWSGVIPAVLVWQRALSEAELKALSLEPGQIFRPRRQVLYFDVGGGTGDTPSAADAGTLALTGSAADGLLARLGVADSGSLTLTGSAADALRALAGVAGSGSITLTGSDAAGVYTPVGDTPSAADSGSLTLTGSAAVGTYDILAAADSSSLTLTGVDANGVFAGAVTLTQADLDAIAAAVWADPVAVAAHAKLDAIIARITC